MAALSEETVLDALNQVEDPELMMGIVDLGLVYTVEIDEADVKVTYSLTSMGCPVGPYIAEQIDEVLHAIEGVGDVTSDLVWSPPWTPDRMSEDAKFALGF